MVNLENWNQLKKEQPFYHNMLCVFLEKYYKRLKGSSMEESDVEFRRLHDGLLYHGIINNQNTSTLLIADIEILLKNA